MKQCILNQVGISNIVIWNNASGQIPLWRHELPYLTFNVALTIRACVFDESTVLNGIKELIVDEDVGVRWINFSRVS